ncbi:MAG: hypothetical protein Q8P89_04105, partial [bacterium]|nr:hypothetical protein [bacterium]
MSSKMKELVAGYRQSINPPYKFKDIWVIITTLVILLSIPVITADFAKQRQEIRPSQAALSDWTQVSWDYGGNTIVVLFDPVDPNIVYGGADVNGPFKSTDGGATWFLINNGIEGDHINAIAIAPDNHNTLYLLTKEAFYKSTDAGNTWVRKTSDVIYGNTDFAGWHSGHLIAIRTDNPNIIFVGSMQEKVSDVWQKGGGIWKSADGGNTFSHLDSFSTAGSGDLNVLDLAISPSNPGIIYAAVQNGNVKRTTDGGNSWTGMSPVGAYSVAIHPTNPNIVFAASENGRIWRTTNGGSSWTEVRGQDPAAWARYTDLEIDPNNPNTIYYAGWGDKVIYKSTDGGNTWTDLVSPANTHKSSKFIYRQVNQVPPSNMIVVDSSNSNHLLVASMMGIFMSPDGGANWYDSGIGWPLSCVKGIAQDPDNTDLMVVTGFDGSLMRSYDRGSSWEHLWDKWDAFWAIDIVDALPNVIYVSHASYDASLPKAEIWKSTNNGDTWTKFTGNGLPTTGGSELGGPGRITTIDAHPTDPNHLVVVVVGYGIYRSSDGGSSWTNTRSLSDGDVKRHPTNPNKIYAAGRNYFGVSNDGGATWASKTAPVTGESISGIDVDPVSGAIIVTSQIGIWKITNEGSSWTKIYSLPADYSEQTSDVVVDQTNPSRIYVAIKGSRPHVSRGLIYSLDGGSTWQDEGKIWADGEPHGQAMALALDADNNNIVYVGYDCQGFYKKTINTGASPTPAPSGVPTPTPTPTPIPIPSGNLISNPG